MRVQNDLSPSPEESIERREEKSSVCYTHTTLHTKEVRKPVQVRLRPSIHQSVRTYCGVDMTLGQFYEEAAILFMEVNPTDRNILVVERQERRDPSMRDRMMMLVCLQELRGIIPALKRFHDNERRVPKITLESLSKTFGKCYKISSPNDALNLLIAEALKYVE